MKKTNKKISLAILALASVSLGGLAIGNVSASEASAATSLNTLDSFRVEKVSVRLAVSDTEQNGGFRFESLISKAAYESLTNVTEVGTLFIPTGFNLADASLALDASGNVLDERVEKVVLEGGAENRRGGLATTDENGAEVISYRAYINDIPDTAYATELTARSYVIADGVTYYTETVSESVGAVATEAYYDVTNEEDEVYCNEVADGWYSPFTAAQRSEIGEYVQTTDKAYADQYVLVSGGNATLDLSKISVAGEDVVGVTVDGAFTEWTVEDTTLTYATTVGEKTLTVATTKGVYDVALVQADNVITTGEEFIQWGHKDKGNFSVGTYTVLANDIKTSGTQYFEKFPQGRVFDGLGHTIDGFGGGMGIVRYLDGGTTTWKNVNYTNYSGEAVLYQILGGVYENITVSGTVSTATGALLGFTINRANTVISNCTFNINHTTAGTALNLAKKGSNYNDLTLIDTTIIYGNGQLTTDDLDLSKGSNYYLYDIDDVNTNYYAKVSSGTATFALSQMGENAPTKVSKLTVNGTEVTATVADGVVSYPATNVGLTTLMMTTDKGTRIMNIVHADNVLTTGAEYMSWIDSSGSYEYTVLANNVTVSGTTYYNGIAGWNKTFDGLGHTIDGLTSGTGLIGKYLQTGGVWKNVNYTNFTADTILYNAVNGTFENITATGTITHSNGLLCYTTNSSGTKLINCNFNVSHKTPGTNLVLAVAGSSHKTITAVNTTIVYNSGAISMQDGYIWNATNSSYSSTYVAE